MKEMMKRTTVVSLAAVMCAGMLAGCGDKALDGTKTVATVDGTEVPLGIVSLYARQQQAQTTAMYQSFMGSAANIWDQTVDEKTGETYGDQAVTSTMDQVELMYILKTKAADYGVEVTEDDQKAISEAAAAFMKANDEETLKELAVTEDQVKTLLELETYNSRMYDVIRDEADVTVTDEEAQQSGFTYVSVSTSGDELTEDDIAKKKEQAQEILDKMKEDPKADMGEIAKGVDESYTALSGTFTTNESDDEELQSSSYPEEVIEALRGLKEGEVASDLIETDTSYYIVRLDSLKDEDATESKKASLEDTRRNDYYTEVTDKWKEEADIKVEDKVLKTLTITDKHVFSSKAAETEEAGDTAETAEQDTTAEETAGDSEAEDTATEETAADETVSEEDTAEEDTAAKEDTETETAAADETAEQDTEE